MNGGFARHSRGFTIVETMIVLAVSMALFISAVALINGKQNVTAFNQSVGDVKTALQQIINQVGSGYYPSTGTVQCTAPGGNLTLGGGGSDTQGRSADCLFMGQVIQFGVPSANSASQDYNIYTLVGLRSGVTGSQISLSASQARVIARSSTDPISVPVDAYSAKTLEYGLTVSQTYMTLHPTDSVGAIGFITNLSSLGTGDGSQRTDVVAIPNVLLGKATPEGAREINANVKFGVVNLAGGINICFNSGGTNQSALISIGGSGRQGTIESKIFNQKNCS